VPLSAYVVNVEASLQIAAGGVSHITVRHGSEAQAPSLQAQAMERDA
jgi:hypothetical protein